MKIIRPLIYLAAVVLFAAAVVGIARHDLGMAVGCFLIGAVIFVTNLLFHLRVKAKQYDNSD